MASRKYGNITYGMNFEVSKNSLNELERILDSISVKAKLPSEKMNSELQKAAGTARQLSEILDKSFNKNLGAVNVTKFNQELTKTHLDMATIKKDLENVEHGSTAFNILSSSVLGTTMQIKTANQALEKMAITLKNTIRYGISSSIFNNFTNSFSKAYDYVKDLDKSLNDIRIVSDASAKTMEKFAMHANEASKRLGASTLDYTNAALIYYQQGLSDEEAKARAEVTIKAANVTGQTGEAVSEQLTAVWNGYKVSAAEAELYIDKLAAVAAGTAADLEELSTGMSKVASAANLMGVDVDQLNAQLATIVSVTRQAPESVGVALKTIYARMSDIKSGMSDETTLGRYTSKMAEYGINVLDANGNLRDMGKIIEEIGGKWTLMSREQQVALSQTIAGTRQYNNLLSLFDNWDMYNKSLKMSENAMGTLQHQQDIYMQSTEAHLKKLKATWQDLYDSAVDTKEVNTGIDLLRNLVQTFDNFIDSFGGGIKTLTGLGTIFANIFNKQISSSIAGFVMNQSKMEQTISALKAKHQNLVTGSSTSDINSAWEQSKLAGVETQLQYAERIKDVESGITQEQYNQLTTLQVQMAELEEKAVLLEKEAEAEMQRTLGAERYENYLKLELKDQGDIAKYWQDSIPIEENKLKLVQEAQQELQKQFEWSKKLKLEDEERARIKNSIQTLTKNTNKDLAKELKDAVKGVNFDKARLSTREKILKTVQKIVEAQEQETRITERGAVAADKQRQAEDAAIKYRKEKGQLEAEFEDTMAYAERATSIGEKVMTVTGSLSSLAMAWSSVNSMFQTWNDENATLGDKISQTIMSVGMLLPGIISAYKSLMTVQKAMNAEKAKEQLIEIAIAPLKEANLAGMTKEQVVEEAQVVLKKKNVDLTKEEVTTLLQRVGLLKVQTAEEIADVGAKTAETAATFSLKKAVDALTASMAANPLMWIVGAATAVVGAISLITSAMAKHAETVKKVNDANIEQQNQKLAEIEANEKLYKQYTDIYSKYEQGKASKDDLSKATDDLTELLGKERTEVIKLTGDYATLNEEINKVRQTKNQEARLAAASKLGSTKLNLTEKAREGVGHQSNGGKNYEIWAGNLTGWSNNDEAIINQAILNMVPSTMLRDYQTYINPNGTITASHKGFKVGNTAEEITELYDKIQQVLAAVSTPGSGYEMDENARAGSEMYVRLSEWIEKMTPEVEAYRSSLDENTKYQINEKMLGMNFKDITDISKFAKAREELAKYIGGLEGYRNKSQEELTEIANNYISSTTSNADELIKKMAAVKILVGKFGEENKDQIMASVDELNSEELSYVIQVDDNASLRSLDDFFNKAKEKAAEYHASEEMKETLKDLGVDAEVFEEYVDTLQDLNKEIDSATLDDYEDQAEKVALSIVKLNKGLETLSKNFETNRKKIEEGNEADYEYVKSLAEVKQSTEDILGIEVSNDFVKDHLEDLQKLVDGDVEALDTLRLEAAKDIVTNLKVDLDDAEIAENFKTIQDYINNFNNQDLIIGSKLDDTDFIDALNNMLKQGQITANEANTILNSIGYQPSIGTTKVPKTEVHHYTRTNNLTGERTSWTESDQYDLEVPIINADKTVYKGSGKQAISYKSSGSGSSKKSGGSSSKNTMDSIASDIDRYHKVNTQIQKVDNSLSKLQSQQTKFAGTKLIENLNKQWQLLNIQINNYNDKLKIANDEQAELAEAITKKGVKLNPDGTISNYAEVIKAQENHVNEMIAKYNKMSAKQQKSYQKTLDTAKEDFEKFKENLNRYDELVSDFIPDLEKRVQDAIDDQIEINVEKFNMEIKIRLDMNEATRDWNEWKKRAIDGIKKDDILGNSQARLLDFYTYFNGGKGGDVQATTKKVLADLEQLYAFDRGENNVFGNNRQTALETLDKDAEDLRKSITELINLQDELFQNVLDEMNAVDKQFDKQVKSYEFLREILNHDMKLIQLAYGDESYGALTKFYQANQDNYLKQLDFQRQQKDFWYDQMVMAEESSEEWESAREKWQESLKEFNSLLESSLENARNKFINVIKDIFQNLNKKVTNGFGLDYVKEEWDLITQNANQYLDSINAAAGIQALEAKYIEKINKVSRVQDQRKITNLMEEELSSLRQRDKLTQYDLDRAEKKYNLMVAQMALEDAQQNKNKMRLRRDSQGNYTYQYVADEDAIAGAQTGLMNAYNDLYNFDKEKYKAVLDEVYSAWNEYQQKMAEAAQINDPELRAQKELLIQEQYGELINELVRENQDIRENLQESSFLSLSYLYEENLLDFEHLTDEEKNLLEELDTKLSGFYEDDVQAFRRLSEEQQSIIVNNLVPQWNSGIQAMAETFYGENGFERNTIDAWNNIKNAEKEYSMDMVQLETISGETFKSISEGEDAAIVKATDLISENDKLIEAYGKELAAVQSVYGEVKKLREEYDALYESATKAAQAAFDYRQKELEQNAEAAAEQDLTTSSATDTITPTVEEVSEAVEPTEVAVVSTENNGKIDIGEAVTLNSNGKLSKSSYDSPSITAPKKYRGAKLYVQMITDGSRKAPYHLGTSPKYSASTAVGWVNKKQISGYDTGGYTGTWDDGGRLAFLHQKELVLNSDDTKNMLNMVSIMRGLTYSLGSSMLARLAKVTAPNVNGSGGDQGILEQNVHIQADFPNVRDAKEIEEALNNLVNAASQRAFE